MRPLSDALASYGMVGGHTQASEMPAAARINAAFLRDLEIWHLVSRNPAVRSCRDAAEHRWRLGGRGIPLCDELKSTVGIVDGQYVALHSRGHQFVDDVKLTAVLGGAFTRLREGELWEKFELKYGLVTPFALAGRDDVTQVFERTVLAPYFPPFTMMTNLGSATWGVEFDQTQLVSAIDRVEVGDFVRDSDGVVPRQHTIGLLTGNSPESGMLLWEHMNEQIRGAGTRYFRGDVAFPRVLVESVSEMGLSMELPWREAQVRPVVLSAAERLCAGGATLVGIACNTTQFFAAEVAEICNAYGARYVSMVDETAKHLRREGVRKFDFLGISSVSDFGGWSAFAPLASEFDVRHPRSAEIEAINNVAFSVKQRGVDGRAANRLRTLVNDTSRTETVVIALTELSEVLDQHPKRKGDKRIIDTLQILGSAIAAAYLAERAVLDVPPFQDG